ncbi:MAG: hypothetical protein WBD56_14330 [Anaerolineales bacterium]
MVGKFRKFAGDIFATMTAEAPTATYTATKTPTETVTPTPTITDTPLPTDTPKPTVPSEPTFGEITFAEGASEGKPVDPATKFPPGIDTVYACWDYWAMGPEVRFTRYWHNNGKEWLSRSLFWEHSVNGSICWHIYWLGGGKGLPPGNWDLKLFTGSEIAQSGTFKIGQ